MKKKRRHFYQAEVDYDKYVLHGICVITVSENHIHIIQPILLVYIMNANVPFILQGGGTGIATIFNKPYFAFHYTVNTNMNRCKI